jgi:hypothetical protein
MNITEGVLPLLLMAPPSIYLMHYRHRDVHRLLGAGFSFLAFVFFAFEPSPGPRHAPDLTIFDLGLAFVAAIAMAGAGLFALYTLFDIFGDEMIAARDRERATRKHG